MNCREFEDFLHEQLDGAADEPPALAAHLAGCDRCRELRQASLLLRGGLRALTAPAPPPDLSRRIVARVLADRRRPRPVWRFRLAVGAAVAAAVLLAVIPLANWLRPTTPPDASAPSNNQAKGPPAPPDNPSPKPAPSLKTTVAEAGQAVVSLTGRLADETQKQAHWLFSAAPTELPPMPDMGQPDTTLEPTRESLRNVTANVGTGLQSVTGTAQQAVSYFSRELPGFGNKSKKQ